VLNIKRAFYFVYVSSKYFRSIKYLASCIHDARKIAGVHVKDPFLLSDEVRMFSLNCQI
jgi:hypothetical protein